MANTAPGKYYPRGITLKQLIQLFPDNAAAERWFQNSIWKETPHCPRCRSVNVALKSTHPTMPYRSRSYRKFFSIKTGTVMEA